MKVKAIIPAAGFGVNFLPMSKSLPKELLPLVNKPAIQYIMEEALNSFIKNFVIITGNHKKIIEDYFDSYHEFNDILKVDNLKSKMSSLQNIIEKANIAFVHQRKKLGLGYAVYEARASFSEDEHVAILLPDDIINGSVPGILQLIKIAMQEKCNVIAVKEVAADEISRYGVIDIRRQFSPNLFQVKDLVEKPLRSNAPSNLAIVGRYVLSPSIFESLDDLQLGVDGELQLTDGIQNMILNGEKVFAYKIKGDKYDIGTVFGWMKANLELALKHPDYSSVMMDHLSKLDKDFIMIQARAQLLQKKINL